MAGRNSLIGARSVSGAMVCLVACLSTIIVTFIAVRALLFHPVASPETVHSVRMKLGFLLSHVIWTFGGADFLPCDPQQGHLGNRILFAAFQESGSFGRLVVRVREREEGLFLDAWGNPIHVYVIRDGETLFLVARSLGPNGMRDEQGVSSDDIVVTSLLAQPILIGTNAQDIVETG